MLAQHPSPSRKHPPFVGQEGHPTSYLQLPGRLCTSPSSWYLKNQLLQHATCEPYSTFVPRLDFFFSVAPRYIGQDKAEGFLSNLYPTQNFQQQASLSLKKCTKKWEKCLYTPKAGKKGRHLLTISIYSSSSVMLNTFLRNTANSCKNSCRSKGQKREDATSEHAEIILQTHGLTAASSFPCFYAVSEEPESPV